jgi:hypothetical protein
MRVLGMIVRDALGVAGVGLLSYGVWLAWAPGGFMALGVMLVAYALLSARANP